MHYTAYLQGDGTNSSENCTYILWSVNVMRGVTARCGKNGGVAVSLVLCVSEGFIT